MAGVVPGHPIRLAIVSFNWSPTDNSLIDRFTGSIVFGVPLALRVVGPARGRIMVL